MNKAETITTPALATPGKQVPQARAIEMTDYCKTGMVQPMIKTTERWVKISAHYPNVGRDGGETTRFEIEAGTIIPASMAKRLGIKGVEVNGSWEKGSEPYLNGTVNFYKFTPAL